MQDPRRAEAMAKVSTVTAGSITLGVAVGPRQQCNRTNQLSSCQDAQTSFEPCTNVFSHVWDPSDSNLQPPPCTRSHNPAWSNGPLKSTTRLDSGLSKGSSLSFTEDSTAQATTQCRPTSGIGCYKRARDIALWRTWAHSTAATPCIQAMIQDGVTAGLLPKHPLETRLAAVIETALSTHLDPLHDALDDEDKATSTAVCSEGGPGSRRGVAANHWRSAGAWCHKPDSNSPRRLQLRLAGRRQRGRGLFGAPEAPTQCAAAPRRSSHG